MTPKSRNRRCATEHAEQCALIQVAGMHARSHPELALLFAVPNGGERRPLVAAKLRMEGVRRGVPDLLLPVRRGEHAGLAIEMKAMDGRASPEQREWLDLLRWQGWRAEVCHGWQSAWLVLRDYLGIKA